VASPVQFGAQVAIFGWNCAKVLDRSRGAAGRMVPSPATEEETQMAGAAFAAAERPQQEKRQDGPFQHAVPVRTRHILAPAQRALARACAKRYGVRLDHPIQYIVTR
jgi:hypothetical protein